MLQTGAQAPPFSLSALDGAAIQCASDLAERPALLIFFETDCPTCQLTFPYVQRLAEICGADAVNVIGISQDDEAATRAFVEELRVTFPIALDQDLRVSRQYDPQAVPTLFLLDRAGRIVRTQSAFDKEELNALAAELLAMLGREPMVLAEAYDGAPPRKPGCTSRHLEGAMAGVAVAPVDVYAKRGARASRIELSDDVDPFAYCLENGFDPLPVIPPTVERVERMLQATTLPPDEIIALIPPNYGAATVEKIAANAVMAGCQPELLRVLLPLVRAACDERFNLHGAQATTHFAAPLIIINGPVRRQLGFACGGNVFSNVARANSTLGRAFQLILTNIGGARPGEIDMSTLGNPGKFAYCIAEHEEASPWEPLHVELGFQAEQSAVTLFAAEPPHGVSEHAARDGRTLLKTIAHSLATLWNYRVCLMSDALVILCPEHVRTLERDDFSKQDVRAFLFANTGVPTSAFADNDGGEGT
jgi:peroxiredoxin